MSKKRINELKMYKTKAGYLFAKSHKAAKKIAVLCLKQRIRDYKQWCREESFKEKNL